jgi:hypothetical protein
MAEKKLHVPYTVSTEQIKHYTRSRHGLFQVPSIIVSNLREDEEKKDIG